MVGTDLGRIVDACEKLERLTHPDCIDFKGPHLYVRIS